MHEKHQKHERGGAPCDTLILQKQTFTKKQKAPCSCILVFCGTVELTAKAQTNIHKKAEGTVVVLFGAFWCFVLQSSSEQNAQTSTVIVLFGAFWCFVNLRKTYQLQKSTKKHKKHEKHQKHEGGGTIQLTLSTFTYDK